jgi:outer membrane PBP1 activator LpoA protein
MILKRILIVALFMLLQQGCVVRPIVNDSPVRNLETQAQQLLKRGDYSGAANTYLKMASYSVSPLKEEYQITAVEYYIRANLMNPAKVQLRQIQTAQSSIQSRIYLAQAQVALSENQVSQAASFLNRLNSKALQTSQLINYHHLKATIFEIQGQTIQALYERLMLDPILNNDSAQRLNHESIWQVLTQLSPAQLKQMPLPAPPNLLGWTGLAQLSKNLQAPDFQTRLADWKLRYPQHPAHKTLIARLNENVPIAAPAPSAMPLPVNTQQNQQITSQNIALLLPMTGQFKDAAEAVRDGFMAAANADDRANKPQIKVHDATPENVANLYQQAQQNGAQAIVGPMGRNASVALYNAFQRGFPVPTLMLYEPEELANKTPPSNLWQFSLTPEDEARQVAEKAWKDGHRNAAIIHFEGAWGDRVAKAFADRWSSLGGQVSGTISFNKKNLKQQLKSVPDTAQCILLGTFAQEARLVPPYLKYMKKAQLPFYATSHVYDAEPQTSLDRELEGVQFPDMPWVLLKGNFPENNQFNQEPISIYTTLQQQSSERMSGANKRLFGFGVDAYRVVMQMSQLNNQKISGVTGLLSIDQNNHIHREMMWAKFVNGLAKPF